MKIPASSLAAEGLLGFLEGPQRSVLPRAQWPDRPARARVRARPGEWQRILRGLYEYGIITFLKDTDLIDVIGWPLVNGAFGVPKEDPCSPTFDPACLQTTIEGDIQHLPLFTQWMQLELMAEEMFVDPAGFYVD